MNLKQEMIVVLKDKLGRAIAAASDGNDDDVVVETTDVKEFLLWLDYVFTKRKV